jgi:PAS domain S-box-containing protein
MSEPAPASEARGVHDATMFWGILEAAPDGFVMVDAAGVIVLVNRQTEALFGYDRAELIGRPVECLLPEEARSRHQGHVVRYADDPHTRPMGMGLDLVGLRSDGTDFPVEVSLSPLDDDGIIAVVRDITARRDAELMLRAAEESVQLLEERERIARDLHDHVIQRLFAAGMALEGSVARADPDVATRITRVVDDLDDTIRQLRSVIFDLQDRQRSASGLRAEMLRVAAEARPALGFEPRIRFEGPVDTLGRLIAEHVLAVLREALSNVARHAHASTVDVRVVAASEEFRLDVVDDGIGTNGELRHGNGLHNLAERAEDLGGSCTLGPGPAGGAVLEWRIPLRV